LDSTFSGIECATGDAMLSWLLVSRKDSSDSDYSLRFEATCPSWQWRKQLLSILGRELIQINKVIKTARSVVSQYLRFFFLCGVSREILETWHEYHVGENISRGFWYFFWLLNSLQRGILVHKNSLASCQRYCHSVESRALTCPFKQSNLSASLEFECFVTVELTTQTYISLRETLFYPSCLLPTVTDTPSDSNSVNRSASLKRFSRIIFTINVLVDRIRNFKSNTSQND